MKNYLLLLCLMISVIPCASLGEIIYPKTYTRDKQEIRADSIEKENPLSISFTIINIPRFSGRTFVVNCDNKSIFEVPANEKLQYSEDSSLGYMVKEMCIDRVNENHSRQELADAIKVCTELGLKNKSEGHANCVIRLLSLKRNDVEKAKLLIELQNQSVTMQSALSREAEHRNALQVQQLELQKKMLEETQRANEEVKQREAQRQRDEGFRELQRINEQRVAAEKRQRERQQDEVNRVQQQLWDANQQKIDRDWRGY